MKEALLIRRVEEKLFELFSQGKTHGTIHTCIGQEFSAIAFTRHLVKGDFIFSNHRCHGHYISYAKDYHRLIAELMGKESGLCAGVGSSQHLCDDNFFSNGIQGGMVPVAAGVALARKLAKSGNIVIVFIGDGTLGEGVVYETMNMASLWRLPLLIVCENNYYSQYTKQSLNLAGDILKRVEAFGITSYKSDTWNLDILMKSAASSIKYVRDNSLPAFHLVDTYRLYPHSKGDDHRDAAELKRYKEIDPINIFSKEHPQAYKEYSSQIDSQLDKVIKELVSAPELDMEDYYKDDCGSPENTVYEEIEQSDSRQVELINNFFDKAMKKDETIIFMGEDILEPYGGAFKVAKGLSEKYPDRVLPTPLSEASITGIANGLAIAGFRPFLEIMFGDFMTLCMDQIINHASKFYHMYNKKVQCPVVIRTPMGGRRGYGPTHSQTLDKFLVGIDNVTVVALNTLIDPRVIYKTVLEKEKDPVIVIENKADYAKRIAAKRIKNYRYEKSAADYPVARLRPAASEPNATIVTYGGMVDIVLDAVGPLFMELEIKPEIIVLSKICPIDYSQILISVLATRRLYVVEEGSCFAAIGSEIISSIAEMTGGDITARRISALPVPIPAVRSLEDMVLPGVDSIVEKIKESLK